MKTQLNTRLATLIFRLFVFAIIGFYTPAFGKNKSLPNIHIQPPHECVLVINCTVKKLETDELEENIDSASITVYDHRLQVVSTHYSNKIGKCQFKLPLNVDFAIKVQRKGYVSKVISVDTHVPEDKMMNYSFIFDIDLYEIIQDLDVSELKEPIAKISYNEYFNNFDYDYDYTNNTNKILKQRYSYYYHHTKGHSFEQNNFYKTSKKPTKINAPQLTLDNVVTKVAKKEPVQVKEVVKQESEFEPLLVNLSSPDLVFKIQVLSMVCPLPLNYNVFKGCEKVEQYINQGIFKYTIGEFKTMKEAQEAMPGVRERGFRDAFLVSYKNDKQVSILEAEENLKENNKKSMLTAK
jgi:hypothetical protein